MRLPSQRPGQARAREMGSYHARRSAPGLCDSKPECAACALCHADEGEGDEGSGSGEELAPVTPSPEPSPEPSPCAEVCPAGLCDDILDAGKAECANCAACHEGSSALPASRMSSHRPAGQTSAQGLGS